MNWVPGRQGGGYEKLTLFSLRPLLDCHLVRYKVGTGVQFHTDHVRGRRHYRFNIVLRRARAGGLFIIRGNAILRFWRICFFRADLCPHAVETVTEGMRLVLSFGTALFRSRRPSSYY